MADVQRTRAALIALFADNVTGQISAQDLRDFLVTVMNSEFANEVDFWAEPAPEYATTDKTGRGWIVYSQTAGEALSAMAAVYKNTSGVWKQAGVSDLAECPALGIVLNTYASNDASVQVLRRGLAVNSAWSARWDGSIGRPVYLMSAGSNGSMSVTEPTLKQILGIYEADGILRVEPNWAVI